MAGFTTFVSLTEDDRKAIASGAEALRTSAAMAGRRGWPVAEKEALERAERLEALLSVEAVSPFAQLIP